MQSVHYKKYIFCKIPKHCIKCMCNAFIVKNASCAKCTLCKVFVVESVDLRFSENWNQCSEPMNKPSIGNLTHFFYKTLHAIFINDTDLYTKHAPVIISLLAQVFCPRPDQTRGSGQCTRQKTDQDSHTEISQVRHCHYQLAFDNTCNKYHMIVRICWDQIYIFKSFVLQVYLDQYFSMGEYGILTEINLTCFVALNLQFFWDQSL